MLLPTMLRRWLFSDAWLPAGHVAPGRTRRAFRSRSGTYTARTAGRATSKQRLQQAFRRGLCGESLIAADMLSLLYTSYRASRDEHA